MQEITGLEQLLENSASNTNRQKKKKGNNASGDYVGSLASKHIKPKPGVVLKEFPNSYSSRKRGSTTASDGVPYVRSGGEYVFNSVM